MKILIRDLVRTTTGEELREMFEAYGRVQSCSLVLDKATGLSKGFGFIEMPKAGEANAAMKNLNGKLVAGNNIRVKKAETDAGKNKARAAAADGEFQARDPLQGVTLEMMVTRLEEKLGWEELGRRIKIKCFTNDPSIASSLKFLRKTPWARQKVEMLYRGLA